MPDASPGYELAALGAPAWWAAAELRPWWADEVSDMAVGYPDFRVVDRPRYRGGLLGGSQAERERVEQEQCGDLVRTWRGSIAPFAGNASMDEIQALVVDLDEDRAVRIMMNGTLSHYDECGGAHRARPQLRLHRRLHGTFEIEIAYRRPRGCPIARSLRPRISREQFPEGPPPHLLNPIGALCVLFPPDGAWIWGRNGARRYTNYTAIWLAKHLAWIEARERGVGVDDAWPGTVVSHDPLELQRLLGPRDLCRCGSGEAYARCCRPRDRHGNAGLADRPQLTRPFSSARRRHLPPGAHGSA